MKWVAFFCGVLFALGLGLGGMTQPSKVVGFLDLFGEWDPSLIFVMAGALVTHAVALRFIRRRSAPVFAAKFEWPKMTRITPRLCFGSMIFGLGWGLAGYCPAPALVSLVSVRTESILFVLAMVGGVLAGNWSLGVLLKSEG